MSTFVLAGNLDDGGPIFAAWDPCAQHVEPGLRNSRFAAFLAPFRTREEAERALIAAGAVIEQHGDRHG